MRALTSLTAAALLAAPAAMAEQVASETEFMNIVQGKTLSRAPQIDLQVKPNGEIIGKGLQWPVTGSWSWNDGYFCRNMDWGGMEIGYNCQMVTMDSSNRIRFTSDRGAGRSAAFRLN
ncbi:MAG: dihydrodipicolinate reductase [Pseudomonadota bacterium]